MNNEPSVPPSPALALERFAFITQIQDRLRQGFPLAVALEQVSFRPLTLPDGTQRLCAVVTYLQREIRAGRRYVGALKLANLLQPDRFEEQTDTDQVPTWRTPSRREVSSALRTPRSAFPRPGAYRTGPKATAKLISRS